MNNYSILIFVSSLAAGGAERVAANLANHWIDIGWRVTIVTLADSATDCYELAPSVDRITLGFLQKSRHLFMGVFNNLRRIYALRGVLRRVRPGIALALMDRANIVLALASFGLPNIVLIGSERTHPPQIPMSPFWLHLRRFAYRFLSAVVAQTAETRDWLLLNTWAKRVVVIPNAVVWPLSSSKPLISPEHVLPPVRRLLLTVGRLSEEKGFDALISAFSHIASRYPDWDLAIVGEGQLGPSLADQIRQVGLVKRIYLPGRVGNVGDWYNAADLYVLSSRFEGFPNTLLEAMAHGLPAVSFDCDTGPRDIIRSGVDGFLVQNGDFGALVKSLDLLMGDEAMRRKFGESAIEVRERFSMTKVAGLWTALFAEVMS